MIPEHYTTAERAAYAQARADASRDFQATLSAALRPMLDKVWCEAYSFAMDQEGRDPLPPDDRPYIDPDATPCPGCGRRTGHTTVPEWVDDAGRRWTWCPNDPEMNAP